MQTGQFLELKQRQQLALTPQLQQSIRLLQLSAQDLEAEIAQAIQENPLLERQEEYDIEAPQGEEPMGPESEPLYWAVPPVSARHGEGDAVVEAGTEDTLGDYLLGQLRLTRATPRDRLLVGILIGELDENGYLPLPLADVAAAFPDVTAEVDEWRAALRLLQSFDPAGVGAGSLSECLLLQLDQRPDSVAPEVMACARRIAGDHLGLLAAGSVNRLCDLLSCTHDTFQAAHGLLLRLDPRPGRAWAASVADFVIPDALVRKTRGAWHVFLNPVLAPRLRVNPLYEHLLGDGVESRALQAQAQQAHSLIKGVNQRFSTVLRVTQAIVRRQEGFFEQGMSAMRPLLLRDVAQELDMHESTVSRATRQKYAQTPWGVIELKRFFGAALATDGGGTTSGEAVRSLIVRMVGEEPGAKPLSDSQIAARLAEQGVVVARRTVAKYREAAGIEPASVRKARAAVSGA